jgi:hypothetical protein
METLNELKRWMIENCCNQSYSIGETNVEGFHLWKSGELSIWSYTERGATENLKYFKTEKEAVSFVHIAIVSDKFSRTHFIGYLINDSEEDSITRMMESRGIEILKDKIPTLNGIRTRFLLVGCGEDKIHDLKSKFNKS